MRHRPSPAGLRPPGRPHHRAHRQPHHGHRPGGRPAGLVRLQPGRARRLQHHLSADGRDVRVEGGRRGVRHGRLRTTWRRRLRPALLPGPGGLRTEPHRLPGRPHHRVQGEARRAGAGVRARVREERGRGAGPLHLAQQRARPGGAAGRSRGRTADLHGRLVRHVHRFLVRDPLSFTRTPYGLRFGGRSGPGEDLVPLQPRPVAGLRVALAGLPALGRQARRRLRARHHAGGRTASLRRGAHRAGERTGGREGGAGAVPGGVPPGRVLRRLLGDAGHRALRVRPRQPGTAGHPDVAARDHREGRRERARRLHRRRVQRRAVARGVGGLGPRPHRPRHRRAVPDLEQRLHQPAVRLLARASAAAAGCLHRVGRAAAGADPGGGARRGDAVQGSAGASAAAARRGAGDRAGRGDAWRRRGRERLRGRAHAALSADGRGAGGRRGVRAARGAERGLAGPGNWTRKLDQESGRALPERTPAGPSSRTRCRWNGGRHGRCPVPVF